MTTDESSAPAASIPLPARQRRQSLHFRLILIILIAFTISLPMVWISLVKVLMFVSTLVYLIAAGRQKHVDTALDRLWTAPTVLVILMAFASSLLWTQANLELALMAFIKHGKLLEILLIVSLIRSAHEARSGIIAFAAGQGFLLLSSWLLAAGIPLPWASASGYDIRNVVFSSYLDQSVMFATSAAVFWHLRADKLWPRWLGVALTAAALINVVSVLEARTGYAVALVVIALAVMWAMPRRIRFAALIGTPIVIAIALYFGSTQIHDRLAKIVQESQAYVTQGVIQTSPDAGDNSTVFRLNAWRRSVQAIDDNPWLGSGVGSWTTAVIRIEGQSGASHFGEGKTGNPHQEYLLWGVELGLGGTLLLLLLMCCLVRDARHFEPHVARATLSVIAAMTVTCLFNSALYDALIGDYFCVILGLLMAHGLRTQARTSDMTTPTPEMLHLKVMT